MCLLKTSLGVGLLTRVSQQAVTFCLPFPVYGISAFSARLVRQLKRRCAYTLRVPPMGSRT
jgi:hypothetical protein